MFLDNLSDYLSMLSNQMEPCLSLKTSKRTIRLLNKCFFSPHPATSVYSFLFMKAFSRDYHQNFFASFYDGDTSFMKDSGSIFLPKKLIFHPHRFASHYLHECGHLLLSAEAAYDRILAIDKEFMFRYGEKYRILSPVEFLAHHYSFALLSELIQVEKKEHKRSEYQSIKQENENALNEMRISFLKDMAIL